jgi:hypothetical protein
VPAILEVGITAALIVLFNNYPDWIGVYFTGTDGRTFVPLLAEGFQAHMPMLNTFWWLSLLLAGSRLISPHRTATLRWAAVAVRLLGVFVLYRLLVGGPIVELSPGWVPPPGAEGIAPDEGKIRALNTTIRGALSLAILGQLLSFLRRLQPVLKGSQAHLDPGERVW